MARRGDVLREHILDTAKEAFLETGFERTTMDAVAARAETSKRSLYAHFPTKNELFRAVFDHVDELFHERMRTPADYSDEPAEAATLYCARFLQMLKWESVVETCRLGITAAPQFAESAAQLYTVFFEAAAASLAAHLRSSYALDDTGAAALANDMFGATIYPALPRLLFGLEPTIATLPDPQRLATDVDVDAIRRHVVACLADVRAASGAPLLP
jgi:AcrR family transcriptional regulator